MSSSETPKGSSSDRSTDAESSSDRVTVADVTRVLDANDISRILTRLAHDVVDRYQIDQEGPLQVRPRSLAIVGIRTGGAHLATRLAAELETLTGESPPVGLLDITLYRDDVLLAGRGAPILRGTEIDFDVEGLYVVVVDDVLYSGRTVRAALDALLDLGRPRCVRLAVLVDRGLRELPVAADFVGRELATTREQRINVALVEEGHEEDAVLLRHPRNRREEDV